MIKEFKITNFFSIKDTQTISFNIKKKDMLDQSSFISPCKNKLNNIVALIGNNASGKTTILKGLSFLLWFISSSYQKLDINSKIPLQPHKLSKKKNSKFELFFEQNKKEYQYIIELNTNEVIYEFLGVKKERGYSYLYEYKREDDKILFSKWALSKLNDDDKNRYNERKNASLFSFLISTGHLPAIGLKSIETYQTNIGGLGRVPFDMLQMFFELSHTLNNDEKRKNAILKYIKSFGLGVDNFEIEDADIGIGVGFLDGSSSEHRNKMKALNITHKSDDGNFKLLFLEESNGTQNAIYLLNSIFSILDNGGILIYDEIENSIHPYLIKKLINLLANKETNPNNAQLMFSTHQPWLLDDRTKTQIYIVEKNDKLETQACLLNTFEGVRNDDNFCAKYLAGAYGGVSDVRWF